MIVFKEVQKIAQRELPDLDIMQCTDIGDRFAFSFGIKATDDVPPGTPIICVDKSNGKVSYLTIPPIETLDLLEKGHDVPLEQ